MKRLLFMSAIALSLAFTACNKTKKVSKRLISAGEWRVTELSVDGVNQEELPTWEIEACDDIYAQSCMAEWKNDEGGHAEFIWQFREKGETFEISHQAEEHEGEEHDHDHAAEEAAEQAYNFSGVYTVVESGKDKMEFTTTSAIGYNGNTVKIIIEK